MSSEHYDLLAFFVVVLAFVVILIIMRKKKKQSERIKDEWSKRRFKSGEI